MDFIQIGRQIIAICMIVNIYVESDRCLILYTNEANGDSAYRFYDEEAEALKQWLDHRTKVLLAVPEMAETVALSASTSDDGLDGLDDHPF